jgi:hypothetical protein
MAVFINSTSAQEFQPVFNPKIEAVRVNRPIKIDGVIDAGEWRGVNHSDNFVETYPGKNLKPDVRTAAYVAYDDDNFYAAFICYDDPSKLRATMCQRDQYDEDDAVYLFLDTYGNATWAYNLYVNPYGIQTDLLWSNIHGTDEGFDMVWHSAATVTDSGYQVEIAVPFASMRFPNKDVQTWKMNLGREYPRDIYKYYSWTPYNYDDNCHTCQWGTVYGMRDVKPGKGFEILPTAIANQYGGLPDDDPDSKWHNDDVDGEMSIGAKYSISSNMTAEATYNPDFSQIEADAAQIDVNSTISLMFPERRPFFQEGRDIFQTLFNSFYTRTVNDPQFAAKLTGRLDRYNIGFLSAYDENTPYIIPLEEKSILVNTGKSTVNVLRATRAFTGDHHLGIMVTDRRFDGGGYGSILSADGSLRLTEKYSVVGQYIMSYTEEPDKTSLTTDLSDSTFDNGKHTVALDGESYSGDAIIMQFRRRTRNWYFTFDYNHVAPSYRTETGYDPWADYHNFSFYNGYEIYPEGGIFQNITHEIYIDNRWNYDGDNKWTRFNTSITGDFRWAQSYLGVAYHPKSEMWGGKKFNDMWNVEIYAGSQFSDALGYETNFNFGPNAARWLLRKGNEISFYTALLIKPIDRLTIEPTINYSRSKDVDTDEELYKQLIVRTRLQVQANKELSCRLVVQYNDSWDQWEIDPLLTYRLSSFSVFYVGSTHDITELTSIRDDRKIWKQTSQQFFMKLQYLFRI